MLKIFFGSGLPQEHAVGLKITGPSPKLLITLIIFKFFRTDPQGVLPFFSLFGNSLQNSQNILFSFPSNIKHLYLSSWNKHVFGLEQVTQMLC